VDIPEGYSHEDFVCVAIALVRVFVDEFLWVHEVRHTEVSDYQGEGDCLIHEWLVVPVQEFQNKQNRIL
jgi:hypothetical protein